MTDPLFEDADDNCHQLRRPCRICGNEYGYIRQKGAQDVVRCRSCDEFQYNAPRTETGKRKRSVSTVHGAIKPNLRARILLRANRKCELCGGKPEEGALHVGHFLSVNDGLDMGLTESELNSEENLGAMCDECNLGIGDETIPLRIAIGIVRARNR